MAHYYVSTKSVVITTISKLSGRRVIINHLYWCVSSTPADDAELIKAKWLSLDNHIHNVHRRHGEKFPKCIHGKLRGQDRNKKWLQRRKYLFVAGNLFQGNN